MRGRKSYRRNGLKKGGYKKAHRSHRRGTRIAKYGSMRGGIRL